MSEWKKQRNVRLKYMMGDKCCLCGYSTSSRALHIHHINPQEKTLEFNKIFNTTKITYDILLIEMSKCCLLCANCHAEVHENLNKFVLVSTLDYERVKEFQLPCPVCDKIVLHPLYDYCPDICRFIGSGNREGISNIVTNTEWSNINVLLLYHRNNGNAEQAGRELGITGNALKRHLKKDTGYSTYKQYEKANPNIFSFKDGDVILNYL